MTGLAKTEKRRQVFKGPSVTYLVEIGLKSVFLKTVSNSMQCIEQAEQENRMQISTTELSEFQYLTNGITELISKSISFQWIEISTSKQAYLPKLSSDCTFPALLNP